MNRKGEGDIIKVVIYLIGSLLVSAMVILAFSTIVPRLLKNTEEQVIAKDIGLTIMTVAASPNNMIYRYDKNTENYEIIISQDEVQAKSREGSGKYNYVKMIGITVEDALIQNKLIIPLTLKDGTLSFSDTQVSYSDLCANIPSNFDDNKIKVKLESSSGTTTDSEKKLEEIISFAKMYSTRANSRVDFVESKEDLRIILQTGSAPEIKYYENPTDQKFSWYHRIACYAGSITNSDEEIKNSLGTSAISSSSEEAITISFGEANKFTEELNKDPRLSLKISKMIYDAIELGIAE